MSSTGASAETGRRARVHIPPRAAVLAIVVTALLLYLVVPLRTYLEQRERLRDLERQTQQLDRRNRDLQAQIARLSDPDYIEKYARECLGMIRDGEIGFVVVPEQGTLPVPAC